jgi:transaldolase
MDDLNRLVKLRDLGQSVWLDFISRDLMTSGELRRLIDDDAVRGMTSNPTIFEKAIGGSGDYDHQIEKLARDGRDAREICDALAVADVQSAADTLRPVFDAEAGADGYVSIEVGPWLAHDTEKTGSEAHRLWRLVDRPNLMVKIPATPAGIPAIRDCLAEGININATLMFSIADYEAVVEAFLSALERRVLRGEAVDGVASVASFFVSRVDTLADKLIDERLRDESRADVRRSLEGLRGQLAVANAKLVYERFREVFDSERWQRLQECGARVQRVLWASTGTKNAAYSDVKYVDELIGADTITTLTPATIAAFRDHGALRRTVDEHLAEAHRLFAQARDAGIDMEAVTARLQVEGVAAFVKSYETLLAVIDDKRRRARGEVA